MSLTGLLISIVISFLLLLFSSLVMLSVKSLGWFWTFLIITVIIWLWLSYDTRASLILGE